MNYKNPIRKELISLPILQMRKLRLREVRNLLKVTQLVRVGVRIESLNSQWPNVLLFPNGDGWGLGTGEVKGEKTGVCDTDSFKHQHRLPHCPGWRPFLSPLSPGLPVQSALPVSPSWVFVTLCSYSHFSEAVFFLGCSLLPFILWM